LFRVLSILARGNPSEDVMRSSVLPAGRSAGGEGPSFPSRRKDASNKGIRSIAKTTVGR